MLPFDLYPVSALWLPTDGISSATFSFCCSHRTENILFIPGSGMSMFFYSQPTTDRRNSLDHTRERERGFCRAEPDSQTNVFGSFPERNFVIWYICFQLFHRGTVTFCFTFTICSKLCEHSSIQFCVYLCFCLISIVRFLCLKLNPK